MCEFAHPNSRGVLGFARSQEEPLGWKIHYTPTEDGGQHGAEMVLSLLLEVMRLGYSASEFLRLGSVCETDTGFGITPPDEPSVKRILAKLMLLEDEKH